MIQIAHRGNGSNYKENSKEAILSSLKLIYVDGVEMDVRMTKDKKFVLSHSEYNGFKKIKDLTYFDLKNISLLDDVLKCINTDKYIFLDLKVEGLNLSYEKRLISLLKKYNLNYYLVSFSNTFIRRLKRKYNYKCGLLKGYLMNNNEQKRDLDGIFSHYLSYKDDEGIWTVNDIRLLKKLSNKDLFVITDNPIRKV